MKVFALTCLLTWGFSLYAYERLQRVSGFAERAVCEGVRAELALTFPQAVVGPVCTEDR